MSYPFILFKASSRSYRFFTGGHWAGTEAGTGRALGGHWAGTGHWARTELRPCGLVICRACIATIPNLAFNAIRNAYHKRRTAREQIDNM